MKQIAYDRAAAVLYAKKWALLRNPAYMDFDGMGGDCTNFASQCLYAGAKVMNYTKDVGWYYNSPTDRAAAWSGVEYLQRFLLQNEQAGPVAEAAALSVLEIGDLIQLYDGEVFYHTLVVAGFSGREPLICAHTDDAYMRPLHTYFFSEAQGLHVLHVNTW